MMPSLVDLKKTKTQVAKFSRDRVRKQGRLEEHT